MNARNVTKANRKGQEGSIILDFLFGLIMSFAFITIFISLAYSLTVVEVVQYMTFSAARKYSGAHKNQAKMVSQGQAKFATLQKGSNPNFGNLFGSKWFELPKATLKVGALQTDNTGQNNFFFGVQTGLTIHLLDQNLPFMGSTNTVNPGNGFQTKIISYLIPEPSQDECLQFNDNRAKKIQTLQPSSQSGGGPGYGGWTTVNQYVRVSDNGC